MDPDILRNLRTAQELLATHTGVRARLVGDPNHPARSAGHCEDIRKIVRTGNLVWFKIKQHKSIAAQDTSIVLHVDLLTGLVEESLDAILQNRPHVQVRITFDGYAEDPREIYEFEEVRRWMRKVFIDAIPQALALLDVATFHVAQTACNPIRNVLKVVGPLGSPLRTVFEVSTPWRIACYMAGIDALKEATRPSTE